MKVYYFIYENGSYTKKFISSDKKKLEERRMQLSKINEPTKNVSKLIELDISKINII